MVRQTRVTREDGTVVAVVTQTQMVLEPRLSPQETMPNYLKRSHSLSRRRFLPHSNAAGRHCITLLRATKADPHAREALLAGRLGKKRTPIYSPLLLV